jgi:alkylmercury lyase
MPTCTDLTDLADRITVARDVRSEAEQRALLALLRRLAHGSPVTFSELSEILGPDDRELAGQLHDRPGVIWDQDGRITGLLGLSIGQFGSHRLNLGRGELSAWCAWDTLFLPELLGASATVTSRCPQTGQPISLTVTQHGPIDIDPDTTVLTLLEPQPKFDEHVRESFCHYIHFVATPQAAAQWTAEHPGTFAVSLDDGYRLARLTNRASFGAALGTPAPTWEI